MEFLPYKLKLFHSNCNVIAILVSQVSKKNIRIAVNVALPSSIVNC